MTMIAAPLECDDTPIVVPEQRTEPLTITDALIYACEAFLGAPELDLVRDALRIALERYAAAEAVAR